MNKIIVALIAASFVAGAAMADTTATPTTKRAAANQWREAGMQPIEVRGVDVAFVRPGAQLAGYKRVLIKPVSVAFRRDWYRDAAIPSGTRIPVRDADRIKHDLAREVREQLEREFARSGYTPVDQPGDDVLEINVQVAELYLNAPDVQKASPVHSYTTSFGELTLIAELRDSRSGAVVMRTLDHTTGRDLGVLRLTTRVENSAEVGMAANALARALRRELDLAKGSRG